MNDAKKTITFQYDSSKPATVSLWYDCSRWKEYFSLDHYVRRGEDDWPQDRTEVLRCVVKRASSVLPLYTICNELAPETSYGEQFIDGERIVDAAWGRKNAMRKAMIYVQDKALQLTRDSNANLKLGCRYEEAWEKYGARDMTRLRTLGME